MLYNRFLLSILYILMHVLYVNPIIWLLNTDDFVGNYSCYSFMQEKYCAFFLCNVPPTIIWTLSAVFTGSFVSCQSWSVRVLSTSITNSWNEVTGWPSPGVLTLRNSGSRMKESCTGLTTLGVFQAFLLWDAGRDSQVPLVGCWCLQPLIHFVKPQHAYH